MTFRSWTRVQVANTARGSGKLTELKRLRILPTPAASMTMSGALRESGAGRRDAELALTVRRNGAILRELRAPRGALRRL
jgi:hypothetical protein